jgi:hypothetical protein
MEKAIPPSLTLPGVLAASWTVVYGATIPQRPLIVLPHISVLQAFK